MRALLITLILLVSGPVLALDTLTIYNIPSPQKYNWQSPQSAYWSLRANLFHNIPRLRNRSLGHNYFKLSCKTPDGVKQDIINGMTMDSYPSDYRGEFHWIGGSGKYGMAFLFHNFSGRLDIRDEFSESDKTRLYDDLNARKNMDPYPMYDGNTGKAEKRHALSFISFEITPEQCLELVDYFEDFKRYGGNNRYGFMVHPLNEMGELNVGPNLGSGCSEFVTSFLEKARLMKPEYQSSWKRNLYIPKALIGTSERPVRRRTMQSNNFHWGEREDSHHTLLSFWDPELMHEWALKMFQSADGIEHIRLTEGKSHGILIKQLRF